MLFLCYRHKDVISVWLYLMNVIIPDCESVCCTSDNNIKIIIFFIIPAFEGLLM